MLSKRLRRPIAVGRARRACLVGFVPESLESRRLLATNLVLDFDGGRLTPGAGYIFPDVGTTSFSAWSGFPNSDGSSGNRTEQILQVLAAVREDFAPFDVRVIWDDRGVNAPYLGDQDQVIMITDTDPSGGSLFGIASDVDIENKNGIDVAFAFGPAHSMVSARTYRRIRELIDTISHEAGHNFGLSHSSEADSERRQITTIAPVNPELDSRFSPQSLNHAGPEDGVRYSEVERLVRNLGANPVGSTDDTSNQTLPLDPKSKKFLNARNQPLRVRIDHYGDRDAYQFTATTTGKLAVRAEPIGDDTSGSLLRPSITLWSSKGDFIAVSPDDPDADFGQLEFNAVAGTTYWVVVGTAQDRLAGLPDYSTPATGEVNLIIGDAIKPNRAPVLAPIGVQHVNEGSLLTLQIGATDPNPGDVLIYSLGPGAPAGMTIDRVTGLISWTPTRGPATANVTVIVSDNNPRRPKSTSGTFTIIVDNVAPTLLNAQDGVYTQSAGFRRSLAFFDPGDDTFTATVDYGDGSPVQSFDLGTSRTLELARDYPSQATYAVTVTITDDSGGLVRRTFRVSPVASTQTATQVTVGRTRFAFNRGISTLQFQVDPSAEAPRPDANGVVRVGGQAVPLLNGRGAAVVQFAKGQPQALQGRYDSQGLGYTTSNSREIALGGEDHRFLGGIAARRGRLAPAGPFRRR